MKSQSHGLFLCLVTAGVFSLAGCGTSAYRERMNARLEELREIEANQPTVTTDMLYDYIPENQLQDEKRFNLRIPRVFALAGNVFHEQTQSLVTARPYEPERLWPLGVQIPGYYWTYESIIPDGATEPISGTLAEKSIPHTQLCWSYSLSFGAMALPAEDATEEMFDYLDSLNVALANVPNAKPAQINLEDSSTVTEKLIQIPNTEETVSWKVIHLEGDFLFTSFKGRNEDVPLTKPGVVEIYSTYYKDHLVILAGTWVKGLEAATLLQDFMPLVAASVKVTDK